VLRVSDRIVVLRLGRTIADVSKNEVTATDVVALITGAKEGQRT
jgi:ABC-type sugar transport system ATPase subunit